MIPLRSNILYQDLGTINQLISQKKFLSMDDEGVAIWWRGILSQIAKRVKQKFYYYDRNRCYNHPDKFNYHTRVLTNSIVEKFIKQKEDPNEYIVDTIRRLVDNSFESREISALEVFLSNINYYSFFLRLKNQRAIIEVPVDYEDAGIQLSGSQRFTYPEGSDKRAKPEDQKGGAYYTERYPLPPKNAAENAKYIKYNSGVFYRLI